jgi:hypothetical protein
MDEMVNHNNQAGRLHRLLTLATHQQDNIATLHAWANVFGIDQQDKSSIFKMLILLQEATDDIKNKISNMEAVNSTLLLSQHPNIEQVVKASNLDAPWTSYKTYLNLAVMLNLAHCAEALSRYDEKPISENELTSLDTDIAEIFNRMAGSSIDPALRDVILDLLEAIRRSIAEYKIRGANGIREELAYFIGKVVQNKDLLKAHSDSEEVASLWKIFARADNMTTVALNVVQIGQHIIKLLT